ncbi:MAG: ATP-binding protein [Pirellulaceae bacterium]|nr:ATP-binding protein [Pirellulaceae bacterium]
MTKESYCLWRHKESIASDLAEGSRLLNLMVEKLEAAGWASAQVFKIHLAAEEAMVNAIVHGNKSDMQKEVRTCFTLTGQTIRVEISDEGDGFCMEDIPDPTDESRLDEPNGRGVHLIKNYVTRARYNALGNQVVLEMDFK